MSVILKSSAFLIRRFPYSETSLILHAFTRSYGKIALIAKGARRPNSKFLGHFEPFQQIELVFYKNDSRELQIVSESTIVRSFPEIQKDVQKYSLASWILELVHRILPENDPHPQLFDAMTDTFNGIGQTGEHGLNYLLKLIIVLFQETGFQLNFEKCGICKKELGEEETYFNIPEGQLNCKTCQNQNRSGRNLRLAETIYLKNISRHPFSELEKFSLPSPLEPEIIQNLIHYISYHFDYFKKFSSVDLWYQTQK